MSLVVLLFSVEVAAGLINAVGDWKSLGCCGYGVGGAGGAGRLFPEEVVSAAEGAPGPDEDADDPDGGVAPVDGEADDGGVVVVAVPPPLVAPLDVAVWCSVVDGAALPSDAVVEDGDVRGVAEIKSVAGRATTATKPMATAMMAERRATGVMWCAEPVVVPRRCLLHDVRIRDSRCGFVQLCMRGPNQSN